MILTEKEANTKLCWRTIAPGGMNLEVGYYEWPEPQFCKGAACMAWRWVMCVEDPISGAVVADGRVMFPDRGTKEYTEKPQPESRGYCGLAGRPIP